jgi:serine phosphatase RsbU (regulator of sigma subunit)
VGVGKSGGRPGFGERVRREFVDLKNSMLSDDQLSFLTRTPRWFRWPLTFAYLLRGLFFKLTPTRRAVLILGVVLASIQVSVGQVRWDVNSLGIVLILFVLMLELKDKLLATTELEDGHAIQRALLPRQSPRVPGWELWLFTRSANEVGGDLVDFFSLAQDRFAVAVGDVAGKGLKAALLTAKLQATLRALAPDAPTLAALVGKVNAIFCRDSLPQMFSSLVYAEIASGGTAVRMINAGHIPPLVLSSAGITQMGKGGPALGLMPGAEFSEETVTLERNDLVVFYSDGVVEARDESGEFFGEERLRTVLAGAASHSPPLISQKLLDAVDGFRGEAKAHDDLTFLLLKRA